MDAVKFKGCTRCGGNLFLEREPDGVNLTCLQCSARYFVPLRPAPVVKNKARKVLVR